VRLNHRSSTQLLRPGAQDASLFISAACRQHARDVASRVAGRISASWRDEYASGVCSPDTERRDGAQTIRFGLGDFRELSVER